MPTRDDRRTKSLFLERFGDNSKDDEASRDARPERVPVGDVPLRLTNERFAAEEIRLQDFPLAASHSDAASPAARPLLATGAEPETAVRPRLRTGPWQEPRQTEPESTADTSQERPATPSHPPPPPDPRASIISHSHQKLHRSFLDADLRATRTIDPPKAAASRRKEREPAQGQSETAPLRRLRRAVVLLSVLLVCFVGYGYLAMRQNNISTQQLPGARAMVSALRGPLGTGAHRAAAAFEGAGDHVAEFLANAATRFDNWRKSR